MTYRFCALLLLVSVLSIWTSHGRTFTDIEGRTLEATIKRATTTTVTLLLNNSRTSVIPLSKLSEADREHVTEWLATRIPDLRITPKIIRSNKNGRSGSYTRSYQQVQTYDMSVEVKNNEDAKGLEESTMKYILVGRALSDTVKYKILAVQEADFSVAPSGTKTIPFRKVVNEYYDHASYQSTNGYKCIGYVLYAERKSDKAQVYAHASTNILTNNIHSIILLKSGDLTDKLFGSPWVVNKDKKKVDPNAPIIVR